MSLWLASAKHANPRSYSIQTLLVPALQARLSTSLKGAAKLQPLALTHSISITRTHASIARQTVLFALIRLGFVLSVKLTTNFLLTILVHSLVLVLNIVALIRHASIALLIVLNAHKMAAHSVMKVFIFSQIKHAVWHAMAPSTLTQTATVKINPTTVIQLILKQVNVRSAETCLRVVSTSNIAYLAAVLAENFHNAKVIK